MRTHVVIDLETYGTGSNAAIAAIGAVAFTRESAPSIDHVLNPGVAARGEDFTRPAFYVNVTNSTGDMDIETIRWWLAQDEGARSRLLGMGYTEDAALSLLEKWLSTQHQNPDGPVDLMVWAHEEFDISILVNAYKRHGKRPPWSYKNQRGLRTIYYLHGGITSHEPEFSDDTVPHFALHDAYREAKALEWCLRRQEQLEGLVYSSV